MKKVVCQCCGETLRISGSRAAFVPTSITCSQCVVDPSRGNPSKVVAQHEAIASSQGPAVKLQPRRSPLEWLRRPLRKVFAPGEGVLAKPAQRG